MKMKVYTKRTQAADSIKDAARLLRTVNRLRGGALIPKGVYRFRSFDESQQWMTRQIAATHAHLKSRT